MTNKIFHLISIPQTLSKEIEDYKSTMEEFNDLCEVLMEKSACTWVRDQTNDLQEKYNSLLSQMQGNLKIIRWKL